MISASQLYLVKSQAFFISHKAGFTVYDHYKSKILGLMKSDLNVVLRQNSGTSACLNQGCFLFSASTRTQQSETPADCCVLGP